MGRLWVPAKAESLPLTTLLWRSLWCPLKPLAEQIQCDRWNLEPVRPESSTNQRWHLRALLSSGCVAGGIDSWNDPREDATMKVIIRADSIQIYLPIMVFMLPSKKIFYSYQYYYKYIIIKNSEEHDCAGILTLAATQPTQYCWETPSGSNQIMQHFKTQFRHF